jgi:hypothetical protein
VVQPAQLDVMLYFVGAASALAQMTMWRERATKRQLARYHEVTYILEIISFSLCGVELCRIRCSVLKCRKRHVMVQKGVR